MTWFKKYVIVFPLLSFQFLSAQRVLYSPVIYDRYSSKFEIAGKTSDYYWLLSERQIHAKHIDAVEQSFLVYDTKLNEVNEISKSTVPSNALKEYLVAGKNYFDKMLLLSDSNRIHVSIQRFSQDGSTYSINKTIANFAFNEPGNSFLLVRSEDKSKIMLLCFEAVAASPPKLHTILFDENWHQLLYKIYQHPFITQPFIQDDFTNYPIEAFNSYAIQLANDGQWLMAAPSRTNNNFLLFHFCDDGTGFSYKEINLPESSELEDLALTINNEKGEAFAGLLSRFHYPSIKNVSVVHYSMASQKFDFDSSYRFKTLPGNKFKNENIIHESFVTVPGNGFLLLKEYGKEFTFSYEENNWDPELFFVDNPVPGSMIPANANANGYTKFNNLVSAANAFHRGDLSLFYFPAQKNESCWNGIISKEQTTDMNSPNLSYALFPEKDKLALLYNSFIKNSEEQYGSSTFLDTHGNMINDGGIAFWKFNTMLNFQQARQIDGNEVAVPYNDKERRGFSIIKF
jgi:hypothetical protein